MTEYLDIPKIPGEIYQTVVDRKIATIQRSTGPIVKSRRKRELAFNKHEQIPGTCLSFASNTEPLVLIPL